MRNSSITITSITIIYNAMYNVSSIISSASAKTSRNLVLMASCFFVNKVVERCFRDGTTKRWSSE